VNDFESILSHATDLAAFTPLCCAIFYDRAIFGHEEECIKISHPYTAIIETLKERVVINLDATPNHPLFKEAFFDKVQFLYDGHADLKLNVTQCIPRVFTYGFAHHNDGKLIHEVKSIIDELISRHTSPLVVVPKDVNLVLKHPDVKFITYGYETRSFNEYSNRDCVVIAFNWIENIDSIKLRVAALRSSPMVTNFESHEDEIQSLYLHYFQPHAAAGSDVRARKRPGDAIADPLLRLSIDHAFSSEILQAIGRARPLQRESPLDVYVVNGAPYAWLPVNTFIDLDEKHADRKKRPHLTEINEQRASKKREAVQHALEAGCKTGPQVEKYLKDLEQRMDKKTIKKYM
jgi:hypothetical protein